METPEAHIVERAQQDDLKAFEILVDKYKYKVFAVAYHMTGNRSDADDIAQDTFIKAFRNLKSFKGRSSFYTWLYRILVNRCNDYLRKRKRRGEIELIEAIDSERYKDALAHIRKSPNPLRQAEIDELKKEITDAIQSLPLKHRSVIVLHDLNGMHHHEIAKVLGCSEGTVRSRLHYARLKLQQKLRRFLEK